MHQESKGYQLLIANVAVLTVFYLLLDFTFRHWNIGVEQSLFWGWGGASLLALPFFLGSGKARKNMILEWKNHKLFILGLSVITILASGCLTWGLSLAGSGPSVLLENTQMIFAVMLGICFLGERLTIKEVLASLVMLVGVIMIASLKGEVTLQAGILVIFGAFFYALQSFLFKKFGGSSHIISFAFLRGCFTALIIVIAVISLGKFQVIPLLAITTLAMIYVLGILVSRFLFFKAHRLLPVSKINMLILLQPVGVLAGTFIFFNDPISPQKIGGAIFILVGAFLLIYKRKKITPLLEEE